MPAPQGQSFAVVPVGEMATTSGLEFQRYAAIVAQQLQARAISPRPTRRAQTCSSSSAIRSITARSAINRIRSTAAASAMAGSGTARSSIRATDASGMDRPFITGGTTPSSTAAPGSTAGSNIAARSISTFAQAGTGQPLFDGRAQARSYTNRLDVLVRTWSKLCSTNFPAQNGETVKITIPVRPRT
jgi:hypothetical protein